MTKRSGKTYERSCLMCGRGPATHPEGHTPQYVLERTDLILQPGGDRVSEPVRISVGQLGRR